MASHWTCRLALALFCLGLSGCPGDPFVDCLPSPEPLPDPNPAPGLVVTGQQVRMRVTPTALSTGCGTVETSIPSSATVEIEGPEGEPIEGQITVVSSFRAPSRLEFTPTRPGPHHIVVTFSQVGGLHQFDLHAAQNRSAEAPRESFLRTCETLERTTKGAWACDSSVLRGSTVLKSFSEAKLAVAGDVVWVVDRLNIRRFVDTGTDLVQSASFTHSLTGAEFILASPDELFVLHSYSLGYYTFNGESITSPSNVLWTRPPDHIHPTGPAGLLLRDGARLGLVTRTRSSDTSTLQVCTYTLVSGRFQLPQGPCPSLPGEVIGFESGVVWTRDLPAFNSQGQNQGLVRRWVWTGGQLLDQGSLSLGPNTTFVDRPMKSREMVPLVRNAVFGEDIPRITAVLTWSPTRKSLLLEQLDAELTDASATSSLYWGTAPPSAPTANTTWVRQRPPPQ